MYCGKTIRFCFLYTCLGGVFLFLTACAAIAPRPVDIRVSPPDVLPDARTILQQIENQNASLKTFQGLGTAKMDRDGIRQTWRMAWNCELPSNFRVIIQNIFGQSALNLAADGRYFYLQSHHHDPSFYKKRTANPSLKPFIAVPLRADDMISLWGGRIPVAPYDSVDVEKAGAADGFVFKLKKRWLGLRQQIYLNTDKEVYKVEYFDIKGRLVYTAVRGEFREIDGYKIPFRIVLAAGDHSVFELKTDQFQVNHPVFPEMFELTPID